MQCWALVLVAAVSIALFAVSSADAAHAYSDSALSNALSGAGLARRRSARDITSAFMRRWRLTSMVASGLGYPGLGFEALELTSLRLPLAQTYSALDAPLPDTYW